MSDSYVCRTFRKGDETAVKKLVESTHTIFSTGNFWDWKYLQNPRFDPSFVAVAEEDGKIVGCNHWLPRKVKLTDSIVVDSMLGAGIAVAPEYRRMGVGRALIRFLRSQHNDRKPSIMYMFADPELRKHFHAPVGGYVPAMGGTASYIKILKWHKVEMNVVNFNERVKRGEFKNRLAKVDLTVAFKVHGAPPLCLHLDSSGVKTIVSGERADVTITSDLVTSSIIKSEQRGIRILIKHLLTRRLKLRGSLRNLLVAYRNIWVFREIMGKKIT